MWPIRPLTLVRPKENYNKSAGIPSAKSMGSVDCLNQDWSIRSGTCIQTRPGIRTGVLQPVGARKECRLRIDHFLVDHRVMPAVKDAFIYDQYHGSDHVRWVKFDFWIKPALSGHPTFADGPSMSRYPRSICSTFEISLSPSRQSRNQQGNIQPV